MSEEKVYLDEGVIKVTSSRVVLGEKNFVLRNIPSVSVFKDGMTGMGITFGLGSGVLALFSLAIDLFAGFLIFAVIGVLCVIFIKTSHYVLIGEHHANNLFLKSSDEETPKRVVAAINEALVELDKNEHNSNVASTPQATSADDLTKFKKMLDDGLITQEDYDAKKKQILGL